MGLALSRIRFKGIVVCAALHACPRAVDVPQHVVVQLVCVLLPVRSLSYPGGRFRLACGSGFPAERGMQCPGILGADRFTRPVGVYI